MLEQISQPEEPDIKQYTAQSGFVRWALIIIEGLDLVSDFERKW